MAYFGFSYIGLTYLILLLTFNIIRTKHPPQGYAAFAARENKRLLPGIYGKNVWMCLLTIQLGIGHIGIHLAHAKQAREAQ